MFELKWRTFLCNILSDILFQCLAPSSQCGIGRILLGKSRACQNCSSSDGGSCSSSSSGKNNPAAWSPTSILCGPCTCQDQRPITSMLMSLVLDVEAVQHLSSLATASSISNSTSVQLKHLTGVI